MEKTEKKRLLIYILVAYGVTYVMGLLMWYGNVKGMDVSAFPNAQMMYPAAGVALGFLLTRKGDKTVPKGFYLFFIVLTGVMAAVSILSVIMPDEIVVIGGTGISVWSLAINYILVLGSIVFWILLLAAGKERRKAFGLNGNMWKKSVLMLLLFVALFLGRTALSCALAGQMGIFTLVLTTPSTWVMMGLILLNFFFAVPAFFGEEYGWRYYLQPLLQKKFGLKGGVLILGVVWGLWHLPVDFFYYTSPEMGLQAAVAQQITCIALGIFFAYIYMKTKNIWVPVIAHFLNNNMAAVLSGGGSEALQNQQITWGSLVPALLVNLLFFGIFIFAKPFRGEEGEETVSGE
ncbi:MAG: CPBP family intramembrane metalloprotease [Clostridiales bacterium]|nr:CPBP family intramembrane metalloprotease [Clostridiales bacterium]